MYAKSVEGSYSLATLLDALTSNLRDTHDVCERSIDNEQAMKTEECS